MVVDGVPTRDKAECTGHNYPKLETINTTKARPIIERKYL